MISAVAELAHREAETVRMVARPTEVFTPRSGVPFFFKVVLGFLALGLVIGAVAIVAGLIYYNKTAARRDVAVQPPTAPAAPPMPANSPAPETETDQIMKDIAEIQKMLTDGKAPSDWNGKVPDMPASSGEANAQVNSSNDGFLALRILPDLSTGEPLAKIPHRTVIRLGYCQQQNSRVAGRTGHWCMTSYDGKAGWVFDAWLDVRDPSPKKCRLPSFLQLRKNSENGLKLITSRKMNCSSASIR